MTNAVIPFATENASTIVWSSQGRPGAASPPQMSTTFVPFT